MSSIFDRNKDHNEMNESPVEEERRQQPFKTSVEIAMNLYFKKLDGEEPANLFKLVMGEAEYGLLKSTMDYARGNQSKASEYLGINRGTLRKKLKEHGLEK